MNLYLRTPLSVELRNKLTVGYNQRKTKMWAINRQIVKHNQETAGNAANDVRTAMDAVAKPAADDRCVDCGIQLVLTHCCPYKVLARVKRQLCRSSRKPHDMTVNEYVAAIQRINEEELPFLPPHFNHTQKLP